MIAVMFCIMYRMHKKYTSKDFLHFLSSGLAFYYNIFTFINVLYASIVLVASKICKMFEIYTPRCVATLQLFALKIYQ